MILGKCTNWVPTLLPKVALALNPPFGATHLIATFTHSEALAELELLAMELTDAAVLGLFPGGICDVLGEWWCRIPLFS